MINQFPIQSLFAQLAARLWPIITYHTQRCVTFVSVIVPRLQLLIHQPSWILAIRLSAR